jgi:hypothetical protein
MPAAGGDTFNRELAMEQWNSLLQTISGHLAPYAPRVLGAAAILLVAWVLARVARAAVRRVAASARLEQRLQSPELATILANIGYWLVWLFALPALLGALGLDGLLAPVNAMMSRIFGFLPGLMGAAVIFGIGFLAARILRQIVTGVLTAAGSERLAARIGLASALGDKSLAGLLGSVVFALVLLPTLAAATQALGLDAVARPVSNLLDTVVALIPKLISAGLIVAIGAVLGRVLAGLVTALLAGIGINRIPARLGLPEDFRIGGRDASELAGGAVMVAAMLLAVTQGLETLGFAVLTNAVATLGEMLARLAVAVIVFGIGYWLATVAALMVGAGPRAGARGLGQVVRAAILFFAAALALRQTGLPGDIIAIAFGAVAGGLALGLAIAIGLGGRKVAGRLLDAAAASLQHKKDDSAGDAG